MSVRRETDPDFINRIANDPAVRPFVDHVGGDAPLDLSPSVGRITQTGVVWFSNGDDAVAAFEQTADRIYDAHVMFAKTCRGKRALETARAILAEAQPYADEIWGLVALGNKAARWFARQLGFRFECEVDDPKMGRCEALVWRAV